MSLDKLQDGASREAKVEAFARHFFGMGKSLEWVMENVAGSKLRHRRIAINVAESGRFITSAAAIEARVKYLPQKGK